MAVETVEIQECYTKKAVWALKQEESDLASCQKIKGEKLEALMGETKDYREQRKTVGGSPGNGPVTESGHGMPWPLVSPEMTLRKGLPDQNNRRALRKQTVTPVTIDAGPQEGAEKEQTVMVGNGLYVPGWVEGKKVSFLVNTGSGVLILAARTWRKGSRSEGELARYWGRLCSVEGRALQCLGRTRLTVTLGTQTIEWNFIVAEIGDDEGILGNDFAMAHELTVRPYEGAMYLPTLSKAKEEHMGWRLPCTIRSVTEVWAITEETLAV